MITKQTKFIIVIAFQLIIIFSLLIFKVAVLTGGTEVVLKIRPVDPRDPLRGDYVTFRYDISTVSPYLFSYSPIKTGDTIYLPLEKQGDYWRPVKGIKKYKLEEENTLFIKGKIATDGLETRELNPNSSIRVLYGIEEYFIPEGVGQNFNFRQAAVRVSIDKDGNAVLKQLYVDGESWP